MLRKVKNRENYYSFDIVKVGFEPVLDSYLDTRCCLLESLEQSLVCRGVPIDDWIFKILYEGMLVALLNEPFYHLISVKQVLGAFNIILQLILQVDAFTVRVHSVFQVLLFVSLNYNLTAFKINYIDLACSYRILDELVTLIVVFKCIKV